MTKIKTIIALSIFFMLSCNTMEQVKEDYKTILLQNKKDVTSKMQEHLDAVSNRNLTTLKSTLSPDGKMQLMLPSSEIMNGVDKYMAFHKEWFKDKNWTLETKILNTEVGGQIGIAITEQMYREPERDGKPYFNRMTVSYGLEKIDGQWYVITDHCTSVEKSTDKK